MIEQSANWDAYYREPDPQKRRGMLDLACASEPDDGANAYRRALFDARHADAKNPGRTVDRMLFLCVSFVQMYQSARMFRKGTARDVRRSLSELRFDEAARYGEAGERALYWEIRNAAARFLSTCQSPGYNRGLFGMRPSGEEGRRERIARDIWQMSAGLAGRTGLGEELALWNRAVLDAYCQTDARALERFDACAAKLSKK